MATDPKASQRSARAYLKRKHTAQAELAGADILDITIATKAPDGHYVIFLHKGKPLHLVLRNEPPAEPVESSEPAVYVPKVWPADRWNKLVHEVRDKKVTHANMLKNFKSWEDTQMNRTLRAVVEAIPDTPDWYMHLPLAPEKDS